MALADLANDTDLLMQRAEAVEAWEAEMRRQEAAAAASAAANRRTSAASSSGYQPPDLSQVRRWVDLMLTSMHLWAAPARCLKISGDRTSVQSKVSPGVL